MAGLVCASTAVYRPRNRKRDVRGYLFGAALSTGDATAGMAGRGLPAKGDRKCTENGCNALKRRYDCSRSEFPWKSPDRPASIREISSQGSRESPARLRGPVVNDPRPFDAEGEIFKFEKLAGKCDRIRARFRGMKLRAINQRECLVALPPR